MTWNVAAALGPSQFDWWQDWRGECVAIIASGPSTKTVNLEILRNRIHVIAIKENVNLCPWADVVYGCDAAWWKHRRGLPEYKGVKLSHDASVCAGFGINKITVKTIDNMVDAPKVDKIFTDEPSVIGNGGNSGFQAKNIAVQFGGVGILLVGFDMHERSGAHWYGRNNWAMANNPNEENFQRWRKSFADCAPGLKKRGIDVVNASPTSVLTCFRRATIEQALTGWGL